MNDTKQPPTWAELQSFLTLAGLEPKGQWQADMLKHLCDHRYAILQGPRQNAGKTWCTAVYVSCCLYKGLSVLISFPTLNQGERILIDRVDGIMQRVEQRIKGLRRIKPDNVRYKRWSHGAMLGAISMAEGSKAGVQGFTADVLVCDEAHESTEAMFSVVKPTLNIADSEGRARIILVGIGGNDEVTSLIETKKFDQDGNPSDFITLRITPYEIIRDLPHLADWYAKEEKNTLPAVWRQHYLCLPGQFGTQRVFQRLSGYVEPSWELDAPRYEFGIDVGRSEDSTFASVFEVRGDVVNLIDFMRFTGREFDVQAAQLCPWLLSYAGRAFPFTGGRYVKIEKTGLGQGLVDAVRGWKDENGGRPFHNARGVHTSDQPPTMVKTRALIELSQLAYNGKFGIGTREDNPDLQQRLEGLRRELLRLVFEIKENKRFEWPHSDSLASLWVWAAQTGGPIGV